MANPILNIISCVFLSIGWPNKISKTYNTKCPPSNIGIGNIFSSAAEATARQPEATNDIKGTVNLPLFLLEGVAIIALVVCILAVVA